MGSQKVWHNWAHTQTQTWFSSWKLSVKSAAAEYYAISLFTFFSDYAVIIVSGVYLTFLRNLKTYFLRCNWIFWSCQEACGILVSWIRTELVPVASEAQSLNRWTIRKSHDEIFLFNTKIVLCFLNIIKSTLFITNRVRLYWICFGLNYVIITWVLNIQIINKHMK